MFYFVLESSKNGEKTLKKTWKKLEKNLKKVEKKLKKSWKKVEKNFDVEKMSYHIMTTLRNWISRQIMAQKTRVGPPRTRPNQC